MMSIHQKPNDGIHSSQVRVTVFPRKIVSHCGKRCFHIRIRVMDLIFSVPQSLIDFIHVLFPPFQRKISSPVSPGTTLASHPNDFTGPGELSIFFDGAMRNSTGRAIVKASQIKQSIRVNMSEFSLTGVDSAT
jgi:hypothetical protein